MYLLYQTDYNNTGYNPTAVFPDTSIPAATVTVTAGSAVVTGVNTSFWFDLRIGWPFAVTNSASYAFIDPTQVKHVRKIISDTQFEADSIYSVSSSAPQYLFYGSNVVRAVSAATNVTFFRTDLLPYYTITVTCVRNGVTFTQDRTLRNVSSDVHFIVDKPFENPILDGAGCSFIYKLPFSEKALGVSHPVSTPGYKPTNPICYNTGKCRNVYDGAGNLTVTVVTATTVLLTSTNAVFPQSIFDSTTATIILQGVPSKVTMWVDTSNVRVTSSTALTTVTTWKYFSGCSMINPTQTFSTEACPVYPGCCGVRIAGTVQPNLFAYYAVTPEFSQVNIRVYAVTVDDNLDFLVERNAIVPVSTQYNQTSVRESNPWAIDVPQSSVARTCYSPVQYGLNGYNGQTTSSGTQIPKPILSYSTGTGTSTPVVIQGTQTKIIVPADTTSLVAGEDPDVLQAPLNCNDWIFGLRGDNRYPQKTGSSEYTMTAYTEFNYPDFLCDSDRRVETYPYLLHKDRCDNSGWISSDTYFTISQPVHSFGYGRSDIVSNGIFDASTADIDLNNTACRGPVVFQLIIRMTSTSTFKWRYVNCDTAAASVTDHLWQASVLTTSSIYPGTLVHLGIYLQFPSDDYTFDDEFIVHVSIGSETYASIGPAVRTSGLSMDHLDDIRTGGVFTGTEGGFYEINFESVTPPTKYRYRKLATATSAATYWSSYVTFTADGTTWTNVTDGIWLLFSVPNKPRPDATTDIGLNYASGDTFTIEVTYPAVLRLTTGYPYGYPKTQLFIGNTQVITRSSGSPKLWGTGFYTGSVETRFTIVFTDSAGSYTFSKAYGGTSGTRTAVANTPQYLDDGVWVVFEGVTYTSGDSFYIPIVQPLPLDVPQVGGAFYRDKMYIKDQFEVNFQIQITEPSKCRGRVDGVCDGGNGIGFVIHNDDGSADPTGVQVATKALQTSGYGMNDFAITGNLSYCTSAFGYHATCDASDIVDPTTLWPAGIYKMVYTIKISSVYDSTAGAVSSTNCDKFKWKWDWTAYDYASGYSLTEIACPGVNTAGANLPSGHGPSTAPYAGLSIVCAVKGHTLGDEFQIWVTRQRRTQAITAPTTVGGGNRTPLGCTGSGNGFADRVDPDPPCRDGGIRSGLALEFDTYYDQNERDPRQGLRHWWINATEIISNSDNHIGLFLTPDPTYYPNHGLSCDHSQDAYHYAATPSIPNLSDGELHTIKLQYFKGFRTSPRQGQGKIYWDTTCLPDAAYPFEVRDALSQGYPPCPIKGDANTKFKSEMKYTDKVVTWIHVDGYQAKVANHYGNRILSDNYMLVDRPLGPYSNMTVNSAVPYNVFRDYPGYFTIFVDEMNMFALRVAILDSEMATVMDADGNAWIGFTGSTGYVHQNQDVINFSFCNHLGCVPI